MRSARARASAPAYECTSSSPPASEARQLLTVSSTEPVRRSSDPSEAVVQATLHAPSSCASAWWARGVSFIVGTQNRERRARSAAPREVKRPRAGVATPAQNTHARARVDE